MNVFKKPINFLQEVRAELGKVSWSTRQELVGSTFVVIAITLLTGVFIGLIDLLFSQILTLLFK
jgi:preprotein translocase subunit SecE